MYFILIKRKFKSLKNTILNFTLWEFVKNSIFMFAGFILLFVIYIAFYKVIKYLDSVELIGNMLTWKLTSIIFLMSFSMIIVSSIIISMTTLYYSFDLKFLFSMPIDVRTIFMDKVTDTIFYSSWTLMVILMPYIIAIIEVKKLNFLFLISCLLLLIPFIALACVFGILFSLLLMYFFPTSRTRDITWLFGSLSISFVYIAFRFSKPEKLIRPDTLQVVAQYINYLQAPTAPYLPSWWLTKAMLSFSSNNFSSFLKYTSLIFLSCIIIYLIIYYLSGILYPIGFNGAQNTPRFKGKRNRNLENILTDKFLFLKNFFLLFLKERKNFQRDVKYWSQIVLIIALIFVYLFSVRNLSLDTPDMKSFVSFLNIGIVGFVISAIALRFLFPSISLEGKSFWILKSAPLKIEEIIYSKLAFYGLPVIFLCFILISLSNYLLGADNFISFISLFSAIIMSFVISVMAIGFGGIFPDFKVENIHKIESSYGGFIFMASSMGYVALTIMIFAWPVQMHFYSKFNPGYSFEYFWFYFCIFLFLLLSFFSAYLPWKYGKYNMEKYEE